MGGEKEGEKGDGYKLTFLRAKYVLPRQAHRFVHGREMVDGHEYLSTCDGVPTK